MKSVWEKIKDVRVFKGITQEEVAKALGKPTSYVSRFESGEFEKPRIDTIEAFAKALKIHPSELLYGYNEKKLHELHKLIEERPPDAIDAPAYLDGDIPVISLVKAGRGGFFDDQGYPVGEGFRRIKRPEWIKDKHAYAVQVEGDSMSPAIEKGWMIVCCPNDQVLNNDLVVAKVGDEYFLKKIKFQDGLTLLLSVNPNYDPLAFKKSEIDWIHKVCLIKPK